ncbi:1-acyl-sn-glycerol-3-phosphate acyltransferase [Lewinella aquimaris]|uniref:1-acyl-sn-glycerol-3-phosphate acyltransferase n=1 Tax=Neolewinella aquimaris TaxID=1835722 RepID=A0A840DXN1_9BACT|nr:1-acyl-sn-glycerol-3-phosphate acyltransferase [Neolewinella aquimaris]MBB4077690.1 1-acyl-sn-glycerol-3-phosphate acyltransferase [Neolewinella aquimaris]
MLYYLVRPVARHVLSYYFKEIEITGLEHIPKDAPVILAANHPTAFLEPCIMACFQPRVLHFLARGDLFVNQLASVTLRGLNMLPVYRIQDGGYGKLTENYATFRECYTALAGRKALMILAEGRCIHEKRLRTLRKGTARIALGALDSDSAIPEVYIVPVGVNFTAAAKVRSSVMIRCGAPLRASAYLAGFRHNEAAGIRELTGDLEAALSAQVIRFPERDSDDLYESRVTVLRELAVNSTAGSADSRDRLERELTGLAGYSPDDHRSLRYAARLQQNGITDAGLMAGGKGKKFPRMGLLAVLLLVPQLPLWMLAEVIALKGPKTIEFYSPVRFATVAVGTLLYLPLLFLLPFWLSAYLVVSTILTRWSLRQIDALLLWREAALAAKLSLPEKEILLEMRRILLD